MTRDTDTLVSQQPATPVAAVYLPAITIGLATAVAMWSLGFITHLPVLQDTPALALITGILLLTTQAAGMAAAGRFAPPGRALITGAIAGLWLACINLMILGSILAEPPTIDDGSAVKPNAALYIAGFITFSVVLGVACAALGKPRSIPTQPTQRTRTPAQWTATLATVATIGIAPVLLTGGLVTSTESGLAVPDWPNSYAANMFLYPLSKMTGGAYYEHTHRLFGSLAGFGVLTLFLVSLARLIHAKRTASTEPHLRRNTILAFAGLVLVSIQGSLGGLRVITADGATDPSTWRDAAEATVLAGEQLPTNFAITTDNATSITLAAMHGVSGQLTIAVIAVIAAAFSLRWITRRDQDSDATLPASSTIKPLATALLAASVLQLVIGALARHHTHLHALYAHAAFAGIVLILALLVGFKLQRLGIDARTPVLSRLGGALVAIVTAQFVLGWVAFIVVVPHWGEIVAEEPPASVLVATAHQALGAAMLVTAALATAWAYRLVVQPAREPAAHSSPAAVDPNIATSG